VAHYRKLNGKTTEQRLEEELQRLKASRESVTVAEFARRAMVSYATLTHQYKEVADEVRRLRDREGPSPKRSPVTWSRSRHPDLEEATTLIQQLRQQVSDLTRGLATAHAERDQWQRRAFHLGQVQDHNERLRGVIAALLDHLVCEADRTMMQHWMDEIDREPQP